MRRKWKCPECGNTDRRQMETNGEDYDSYDLTVLCVAQIKAKDHQALVWFARGDVTRLAGYDPADGTATCGEQFDPNAEE